MTQRASTSRLTYAHVVHRAGPVTAEESVLRHRGGPTLAAAPTAVTGHTTAVPILRADLAPPRRHPCRRAACPRCVGCASGYGTQHSGCTFRGPDRTWSREGRCCTVQKGQEMLEGRQGKPSDLTTQVRVDACSAAAPAGTHQRTQSCLASKPQPSAHCLQRVPSLLHAAQRASSHCGRVAASQTGVQLFVCSEKKHGQGSGGGPQREQGGRVLAGDGRRTASGAAMHPQVHFGHMPTSVFPARVETHGSGRHEPTYDTTR